MLSKIPLLKFRLDVFCKMIGLRGGLITFHLLLTPKKDTETSDFQSDELCPIQSLCDHTLHKIYIYPGCYFLMGSRRLCPP